MNKFVLRISIFLALLLSVYFLVALVIIQLHRIALDNCDIGDVNSLIIGDSHTMWSIDDTKIGGARNISLNGEGYKYSYLKLKYLLESNPDIEEIYIGFGYHNLSSYYDDYIFGPQFSRLIHRYLSVLTFSDYVEISSKSPKNIYASAMNIGKNGWRPAVKQECPLFGSFPDNQMHDSFKQETMERRLEAQFFQEGELLEPSASNYEYLQKIVALSREHGIEPMMLKTPTHNEYTSHIPEYYSEMYEAFLSAEKLSLITFEDLVLTDDHFLPDGDHTNYSGAMKVTEEFVEILNER